MDQETPSSSMAKRKLVTKFLKPKQNKPFLCNTIPHQELKLPENPEPYETINDDEAIILNRATVETFLTELFATVSALKAAYAEYQLAQFPYNQNSIQSADESVVQQLQTVSNLKQSFFNRQIQYPNIQYTLLKAEILEMQSLIKMYKITIMKLQVESEKKEKERLNLETELNQIISNNKLMEKKLSSRGHFSVMDTSAFSVCMSYTVRSVRHFVKQMVCEMESVKWDIDAAARSISSGPQIVFRNPNDRCFAFESFVSGEMFAGFDIPHFGLLKVVHSKMEVSFFGNPRQRRQISSGECPETELFESFAEMARRVWLLHCLAFTCGQEVSVFQVGKGIRFTEMYMESVTDDLFTTDGCLTVGLTVEPGFRIGKTVIQSQVYVCQ